MHLELLSCLCSDSIIGTSFQWLQISRTGNSLLTLTALILLCHCFLWCTSKICSWSTSVTNLYASSWSDHSASWWIKHLNIHNYAKNTQIHLSVQPNSFYPLSHHILPTRSQRWLTTSKTETEILLAGPKSLFYSNHPIILFDQIMLWTSCQPACKICFSSSTTLFVYDLY